MRQAPLIETTKRYFEPPKQTQRGIELYNQYAKIVYFILAVLVAATIGLYAVFGTLSAVILVSQIGILVLLFEILLRVRYDVTPEFAVKYYALQLYESPSKNAFKQLESWNSNPFDLRNQYRYAKIGKLLEDAKSTDDSVLYAHNQLPDIMRMIEYSEREDYGALLTLEELGEFDLPDEYVNLIREINYTYKFGAYTSVSILLRKLAQQLTQDILMAKGAYDSTEYKTHQEEIDTLLDVLSSSYTEETLAQLKPALDESIRKTGNKAAHSKEQPSISEIEDLMSEARKAIRLLLVIRKAEHT